VPICRRLWNKLRYVKLHTQRLTNVMAPMTDGFDAPAIPRRDAGTGGVGCSARPILQEAATQALESCVLIEVSRRELIHTRTLLAKSRSMVRKTRALIDEYEQLLADRRALVDESKPLLPQTVQKPLAIRVFREGSCFRWRVFNRANEILGRGTAETPQEGHAGAVGTR
jgi:hypothetical protein